MANGERPDRLAHANVRLVLETYLDRHNADSFPWLVKSPDDVEVGAAAVLFETHQNYCLCGHRKPEHKNGEAACSVCLCNAYQYMIVFCGRLDLLAARRDDPRRLCPVDHKTTGQLGARFANQYHLDSQLSGYMWLAGQYSGQPVHTAFINALELGVIPSSNRKCPTHGVEYAECGPEHAKFEVVGPIERSARQIDEWADTAVGLALRFRKLAARAESDVHKLRTEGTFNGSCSWCEFREFCLADRPAKQMDKMFTRNGWDVYRHVFGEHPKRKPDPRVFYVDNSILKATASCATQAAMRYGWGFTNSEQSGPLLAGLAVHAGLETWFKGGTAQTALAAFDEAYLAKEAAA